MKLINVPLLFVYGLIDSILGLFVWLDLRGLGRAYLTLEKARPIGIALTTHRGRPEFKRTYKSWQAFCHPYTKKLKVTFDA